MAFVTSSKTTNYCKPTPGFDIFICNNAALQDLFDSLEAYRREPGPAALVWLAERPPVWEFPRHHTPLYSWSSKMHLQINAHMYTKAGCTHTTSAYIPGAYPPAMGPLHMEATMGI